MASIADLADSDSAIQESTINRMIRPAAPEDTSEWVRMRNALWPECSPERHALEIRELTRPANGGIVLVATNDDGSLGGFIEISIRGDHVEGTSAVPVPYVEGWYVDPEIRGQKIGRKLLEAAEKWATARGFRELASDAEVSNPTGIRAHLASGFTETCRTVHFVKQIMP